ncbi:MAG: LacI family DNA-binding transcriptional regulator [Pseudomonadota bacterium]
MATSRIRNMEEFAVVSGISRPTLSKYFNDPDSVRRSTRDRIEAALARHDYRPNIYAINQNRRLTKNIGIVVPYLADPFFAEIARNLETLCLDAGFRPILQSSHGEPATEVSNLDGLRAIKPAGVLLAPLGRASEKQQLAEFCNSVPTVLFDSNIDELGDAFVGHDNLKSIGLMVDYLCETGGPPVFFEMDRPTNPNAYNRRRSYGQVMTAKGLEPRYIQVEGDGWDFEAIGYRGAMRAFTSGVLGDRDTILCSNDRLAIGVLSAAYDSGLRVGCDADCDLRVAGHDDHPFSQYTCPRLTTVSQNYGAIAESALDALLSMVESGHRATERHSVLYVGNLVPRGSA